MALDTKGAGSTFDQWSIQQVKDWMNSWNSQFGINQTTINSVISIVDTYQIDGMVLLYLTKDDLKEFGINATDINTFTQRIDYLRKKPQKNEKISKFKAIENNNNDINQNDDNAPDIDYKNDHEDSKDNAPDMDHKEQWTEGYATTKGKQVCVCLQKGNKSAKMVIDSSATIYELKQKYMKQNNDNYHNINDIVLLYMGKVLDDKKTLDSYCIGYKSVSMVFVAQKITNKSKKPASTAGEAAGILFINKNDNSEHVLYVDTDITFDELKKMYKQYLVKEYQAKQQKKQLQMVYEKDILFECSGMEFEGTQTLSECGIGMTEMQYIFVSFIAMKQEEKKNDDIKNIYKMTPKEHTEIVTINKAFEKSSKSIAFTKSSIAITKTFKSVSKHQNDVAKSFHDIDDIVKEETSEHTKKATKYTNEIMSKPPTGKLGDMNTTLHVINSIFKSAGDKCIFYDSRQGVKLKAGDSGCGIQEAFVRDKPFVLRLKTLKGLYGVHDNDMKDDTNKLVEMQSSIDNKVKHPTIEHVKNKLSAAFGVKKERINVIQVFAGSDCFKYTVSNLTWAEKNRMIQASPARKLAQQFQQFKDLKIHPLLFRPAFDVAMFDKRGDKSFVSSNSTYQIGPANNKKKYTQPHGWTRYGLKVLGVYNDDKWLHPFNDANNWWRAFHGTKNAANYNVQPVNAIANIHQAGFNMANVAALGPGVYCSSKPTYVENSYAAQVTMTIRENNQAQQKNFKFMLQVAVKPGDTLQPGSNDNVWCVKRKDDIRAYGILIKEV